MAVTTTTPASETTNRASAGGNNLRSNIRQVVFALTTDTTVEVAVDLKTIFGPPIVAAVGTTALTDVERIQIQEAYTNGICTVPSNGNITILRIPENGVDPIAGAAYVLKFDGTG